MHRDLATAMITFHEAVARRLGVTAADQRVLGVLGRMGVATPSQLAESTGLTTGAITGIVDRLERAGFARRAPNPADRRSVLVHACNAEALGKVMRPIFDVLSAEMAALRARYTQAELERSTPISARRRRYCGRRPAVWPPPRERSRFLP